MLLPFYMNKKPAFHGAWKSGPVIPDHTDRPLLWARIIPEGEVVFDFDDGLGPSDDWPDTRTLVTPRGYHLHYRSTWLFKRKPVYVDNRRVDVLPSGTLEFIGGPGRHLVNTPIADLPVGCWVCGSVGGDGELGRSPHNDPAYLKAVRQGSYKELAEAPVGTRNNTLNRVSFRLSAVGDVRYHAHRVLWHAARKCGLSVCEFEHTFNSGWIAGFRSRENYGRYAATAHSPGGHTERWLKSAQLNP